jgi:hypothetical protein
MIASGLGKDIQQHAFLGRRFPAILRGELPEQCTSVLKTTLSPTFASPNMVRRETVLPKRQQRRQLPHENSASVNAC